jgi:hypothetical protein
MQPTLGAKTRAHELLEAFARFDAAHPSVWKLFERFAFDRIERGFQHYSADAILHRIRWETATARGLEGAPKLSDWWTAFYARKFMNVHPEYRGFFRTRRQPSRDRFVEAGPFRRSA